MARIGLTFPLLCLAAVLGTGGAPALADNCKARCDAEQMRCLQDSKGDTARCNQITTRCYESCRKPK
jgi:hypothetical protein